ncbi:MAG: S-adenosyl-L-methionine-dependent methyltransferase [Olpidium bornovanus]|uniref:Leucine carboxyl methyltransferase 1 n=1 Tax=Olpidium bornovanus TaxID=278681 RepID=A0A8H7ZUU6_9FUNG|nr:MAG: S-adenosyl-L-methionine-dependent methyltransferase [Olpidium bornovanus]
MLHACLAAGVQVLVSQIPEFTVQTRTCAMMVEVATDHNNASGVVARTFVGGVPEVRGKKALSREEIPRTITVGTRLLSPPSTDSSGPSPEEETNRHERVLSRRVNPADRRRRGDEQAVGSSTARLSRPFASCVTAPPAVCSWAVVRPPPTCGGPVPQQPRERPLLSRAHAVELLSAVNAGYLRDEFAKQFARRPVKRPPVINRGRKAAARKNGRRIFTNPLYFRFSGTYCRTAAIDLLVERFLGSSGADNAPKQIVSLGAGSDSRFLLLKAENRAPSKYFEIDFLEVTAKKAALIKRHWWDRLFSSDPSAKLGTANPNPCEPAAASGGTEIHAADYSLIAGDLREWDKVVEKLASRGFDTRYGVPEWRGEVRTQLDGEI